MTFSPDHLAGWRDELRARAVPANPQRCSYLLALLGLLDGRVTDLPLSNPYRPYLLLTRTAIRSVAGRGESPPSSPTS